MLGIALDCSHEVGDKVGTTLIYRLHISPLLIHRGLGLNQTVVL
jgi:hypothetical protein